MTRQAAFSILDVCKKHAYCANQGYSTSKTIINENAVHRPPPLNNNLADITIAYVDLTDHIFSERRCGLSCYSNVYA